MFRGGLRSTGMVLLLVTLVVLASSFFKVGGARALLAFVPPGAVTAAQLRGNELLKGNEVLKGDEALSSWLTPCSRVDYHLGQEKLQSWLYQRLEAEHSPLSDQGLKKVMDLSRKGLVTSKILADNLLEIRVKEADPALAVLFCKALLEYVQQRLAEDYKLQVDEVDGLEQRQASEDELVLQEDRLWKAWRNQSGRNRATVLQYALAHYAESWEAGQRLRQDQAKRYQVLQQACPLMVVVVPPEPSCFWGWDW